MKEGGSDKAVTGATFTFFPTMFVSDFKTSSVLRYNADTGAFFDVFVQPRSGGLDGPWGLAFGLDHNFYVSSARTATRYTGTTATQDRPAACTSRVVAWITHGVLFSTSTPTTHMSPVNTKTTSSDTSSQHGAFMVVTVAHRPMVGSTKLERTILQPKPPTLRVWVLATGLARKLLTTHSS